jgi:hypothetical protein
MDAVAANPPFERSRFITLLGWIFLALGALAPVRLAAAFYDGNSALYCSAFGMHCIYEPILGALAAGTGWGLIRRCRWTPFVLSATVGAFLALGAGSLYVMALKFLEDRDGSWSFFLNHGGFVLLNGSLIVGSLIGLTTLFRVESQREFQARHSRPVVLASIAFLSYVSWLGLNWYCWVNFVR